MARSQSPQRRVAPALCNQREPGCRVKDPARPRIKNNKSSQRGRPHLSYKLAWQSLLLSQEINAEGCVLAFFPSLLYDLKILSGFLSVGT